MASTYDTDFVATADSGFEIVKQDEKFAELCEQYGLHDQIAASQTEGVISRILRDTEDNRVLSVFTQDNSPDKEGTILMSIFLHGEMDSKPDVRVLTLESNDQGFMGRVPNDNEVKSWIDSTVNHNAAKANKSVPNYFKDGISNAFSNGTTHRPIAIFDREAFNIYTDCKCRISYIADHNVKPKWPALRNKTGTNNSTANVHPTLLSYPSARDCHLPCSGKR